MPKKTIIKQFKVLKDKSESSEDYISPKNNRFQIYSSSDESNSYQEEEDEDKQVKKEDEQVKKEDEQVKKEDEQVKKEDEQVKKEDEQEDDEQVKKEVKEEVKEDEKYIKKGIKINRKMRQEMKDNKNKIKNNFAVETKKTKEVNNLTTIFSESVEIDINGITLIKESDIVINSNTKYFVLGQNGIGKTTLLIHIYNKLKENTDILMIEQDIEIDEELQTIEEFMLNSNPILFRNWLRITELEEKNELSDKENEEYQKLSEYQESYEWNKFQAETYKILNGLGFNDIKKQVSILSGGWRMRLALGKALLRKPEVLVLDEPTNHLDLSTVIWLTDYLTGYKKTLIVITHQIGLVNSIADVIWYIGNPELKGNKVYTIKGTYDRLKKFLNNTFNEVNNSYEKFQKRVEEMRRKSTPKKDVDEFIKKNGIQRPPKPYTVSILWNEVTELNTKNIIEMHNISFDYGSNIIYKNLNIALGMGSRIVLVGENGVGKTTFFKLISEQILPKQNGGYMIKDNRLRIGYYNQQIMDNLPLELTPIQYLKELNSKLDQSECRAILGKVGIKKNEINDLPNNKIINLSGGQKARVALASIQIFNPHLLLLDEPTNHLDIESIEGLIEGINNFNGGVAIITHDIYLIESVENCHIYEVKNNNIIKYNDSFDKYLDKVLMVDE